MARGHVPGSTIDGKKHVEGRGGVEASEWGKTAPARKRPAAPKVAAEGGSADLASTPSHPVEILSDGKMIREQKMLEAAYAQQQAAKLEPAVAASRAKRGRAIERHKDKQLDFFKKIFDVGHHMQVIISPLPPAVRYSLSKQFSFLTSIFTMFLDKDGVQNARRALYGQKGPGPGPGAGNTQPRAQQHGRRIVKKQVIRRVRKKKAVPVFEGEEVPPTAESPSVSESSSSSPPVDA